MGAGWGWVFVGTMLVMIGLYLGLGMIITRGKFPHADFWAGFVALVRDGMWWSMGMKGEVTVAVRVVPQSARRYSDLGHICPDFETKRSSRKERKRKERKERHRRASIDSPYGATGHTQWLHGHRPQASRDLDTVAALFAHHGVQVHEHAAGGSRSSDSTRAATFEPPYAGQTPAAPVKPQPASMPPLPLMQQPRPQPTSQPFSMPALAVPHTRPHSESTQHPPPTVAAAPYVANALKPVAQAEFSTSTGAEVTAPSAALQQQQGTKSVSASATSGLSKLQPAALSIVASAPSTDDDTITPRTRRIGNFARRQAGMGGYTASVSAAPVRLLPQGKRN